MNLIGALDTPTCGQYLFNGYHVEHFSRDQRALFKKKNTWDLCSKDSICLPAQVPWRMLNFSSLYRGEPAKVRHELCFMEALEK